MSSVLMSVEANSTPVPREAAPRRRADSSASVRRLVLALALPVGLAVAWELAVRAGLSNGRLMPPPSRIWQELEELARNGELYRHIAATLLRVAVGFGLGTAAGTILGALAGYSSLTRRLIDPTLQGLRAVPSIAWIPLFILWLGIFETSKVALIAVGVFFPVYLGVMAAILAVDARVAPEARVRAVGVLGAGRGVGVVALDERARLALPVAGIGRRRRVGERGSSRRRQGRDRDLEELA